MRFVLAVLCAVGLFFSAAGAESVRTSEELSQRIVPEIADSIVFEEIIAGTDTFSVSSRGGKVLIQGSSPIAMSVGLNNYLRKCLGVSVSWFADDKVDVPQKIVLLDESDALTGKAIVNDRFFLNYCTFGYTTPFWTWREWERLIDWMALNGVNMPLAMTGQEKVWFETWRRLGLAEADILESFTGPAHLPWHWMANIDHYQGPLTKKWLDSNEELQKKILSRERAFGMKPVLPAFSGHVPEAMRSLYPDANITLRQPWCGFKGKDNSWFLNPSDPLYSEIQSVFVMLQDSIFGTDHIYGIDPFNEIDSPDWSEDFLRSVSSNIYSTLTAADPQARWLQMTWTFYNDPNNWTKPRIKAFLDGVPDDGLILLDYYIDAQPVWKITDAYFGKPYILCYLGNFGGNTMIIGNLRDINKKINDFIKNGGANKSGMGGTLEGLDVNQVIHEFMFAKVWDPELTPEKWIDIWAETRGGREDARVKEAWRILNEKIYVDRTKNGQGGLTNVRPTLDKNRVNYADANYSYDNKDLLKALDLLLSAGNIKENESYKNDVMNVTRQLLANEFMTMRDNLAKAYYNNNADSVETMAVQMDSLMQDLDRLMSANPGYSLKRWIELARNHGDTDQERDAYEKNARSIVTLWGYPGASLNDYANRHWSGLIDSFYRVRWNKFTDSVVRSMKEGKPFSQDAFNAEIIEWENEWTESHDSVTDISDENPVELAKIILKKYFK